MSSLTTGAVEKRSWTCTFSDFEEEALATVHFCPLDNLAWDGTLLCHPILGMHLKNWAFVDTNQSFLGTTFLNMFHPCPYHPFFCCKVRVEAALVAFKCIALPETRLQDIHYELWICAAPKFKTTTDRWFGTCVIFPQIYIYIYIGKFIIPINEQRCFSDG